MRSRKTASNPVAACVASALDMTGHNRWLRRPLAGGARDENAGDDHRQGVDDAGGEGTDREDVSRVGLAEELAAGSGQTIADEKNAREQARLAQGLALVREPEQERKQERAFEQGLVELAWVTRRGTGTGKD